MGGPPPVWLRMTSEDPRAIARAAKLRELNARHGEAFRRASALRDAASKRVLDTGAYFDEVSARNDAITAEGGAELAAAEREAVELEREIVRVGALPLSDFG
jgi:hypothetical protein